ncbi:MAG: hypothetical protein RLZZ502_317 [Pseudomonadota bacterium]|jgi:fused signal recognition particle receptor
MFSLFSRKKTAATESPASAAMPTTNPEPSPVDTAVASGKTSFAEKLKRGLANTRAKLGFASLFSNKKLDAETLDDLETLLLSSDVGVAATADLLSRLQLASKTAADSSTPKDVLKTCLIEMLLPIEGRLTQIDHAPYVIMVAGVNGAGKTTSIGKLAKHFQAQGLSVLLAAGDTFRAAAREQLLVWGERNGVAVIQQESGDPAAVMFDAVSAAIARKVDVVIADTAGRLPSQLHLMEELKKVKRVLAKALPLAPHETLLIIDGNTGQNAIAQVKAFDAAIGLTGLVVTKLDGSAKGGVVVGISKEHPVPIKFIGVGEQIDDLRPFVAEEFVSALVD